MGISEILSLCGGLALFLYGMHMMSSGLEAAAGDRMKQMLEKLTSNTIMGVVIGTVITALIQSSSATTVMLVGFVNSGIMDLSQTVGIIMGANIGATMNGVLLAVGIGDIAPAFAFIGVCLLQFTIGEIIAGLGILFIGMNMMSSSMSALRNSPTFIGFLSSCSNPILAILVGTVFTALIQSSSASVGILQALAVSGVVDLHTGIYLMFGFTIGTCITAAIASIGTTANAKRTTVIHFLFNVIGTVIFVIFCQTMPVVDWIIRLTPNSPASQVANAHVIFKVVTTLILLPFSKQLVNLSVILIKDKKEDKRPTLMERAKLTAGYSMGTSAIIIRNIRDEINYMYDIAKKNVELSYDAVINNSSENMKVIRENEDHLDELNASISEYISNVLSIPMSRQDSDIITGYFRIVGNIERIGDHADNFAGYSRFFISRGLTMSDAAVDEVRHMKSLTVDTMEFLEGDRREDAGTMLINVSRGEQDIDDMTDEYRNRQMDRMKDGVCTAEVSVIYSEMLTDFERIGDHLLNIAEDFSKMYPAKKA